VSLKHRKSEDCCCSHCHYNEDYSCSFSEVFCVVTCRGGWLDWWGSSCVKLKEGNGSNLPARSVTGQLLSVCTGN
jgi:hypothetical protein